MQKWHSIYCCNCRLFLGDTEKPDNSVLCQDCARDKKDKKYRKHILCKNSQPNLSPALSKKG